MLSRSLFNLDAPTLGIAIHPDRVEAFLSGKGEPKFESFLIPEGWIDPRFQLVAEPKLLGKEIRRQLKARGLWRKKAFVGISGTIVRQTNLPLNYLPEKEELKIAITTEAERYAMFTDSEAQVDLISFGIEEHGVRILYSAIRKDVAKSYEETMAAAGLGLLSLEPLSLAHLRAFLGKRGEEEEENWGLIVHTPEMASISTWKRDQLQVWRELYPSAFEEATDTSFEIQRTIGQERPQKWHLVSPYREKVENLRPLLSEALVWLDSEQDSGLLAYGVSLDRELGFPKMDLRSLSPSKGTALSKNQVLLIGAAAFYACSILTWRVLLEQKVGKLQQQLEQTKREAALLQTLNAMPVDPQILSQREGVEEYQAGLETIRLFRQLRDLMPGDTWFTRLELDAGGGINLEGYALSEHSPTALALAINQTKRLSVQPPRLSKQTLEQTTVYRFSFSPARLPAPQKAGN